MVSRRVVPAAAVIGWVLCPASAGVGVSTAFDTDAEGWTTDKDARDFEWVSSGGNPDGHVRAVDIGTGEYWRFAAPAAYLGDRSSFYGSAISYDIKQTGPVGSVVSRPDIRLVGGGVTIEYFFGVAPGSEWIRFAAFVAEGEGWMVDDRPATEAEIRGVLASLSGFSIRGEYRTGADSAALDNVSFGGCLADFNEDGTPNFFDIADFITAFNAGGV
ncbi:MAG: laminin B domain-containing protein, partial [Planctomycetota bacterium]